MEEHRCKNCKKLLFKGAFIGTIQILCSRCKKINEIETMTECQSKEHQP